MASKTTKNTIIKGLKRFWDFLWNEDSIWSWIVNIVIAFVLIKFLIYPGIGLMLGTSLPVVAVISESMSHHSTPICEIRNMNGACVGYYDNKYEICGKTFEDRMFFNSEKYWTTCGSYYEKIGITKDEFSEFHMKNGFNKGDIIILKGVTFEELKVGDILVYQSKLSYPVIHRVIAKNDLIETKGDHNSGQIASAAINEKQITKDQMIGKAWIKIPYLGYVKIWFTQLIQCITFNGCSFR